MLIGSLLLVAGILHAQTGTGNRVLATHYGVENGLPHSTVSCVLQSRDGFLWFGTWYGLSRFDGTRFYNFTNILTPTSDQPPRKVETIVEDSEGNLWIKTLDWKLSVLFTHTERFEDVFKELQPFKCNLQIIKIEATADGRVMILTKDKNLLIGTTRRDGSIDIRRAVSSRGAVDPATFRLRHSVTTVDQGRASYVGPGFSIFSVPLGKKSPHDKAYWSKRFDREAATAHVYHDREGGVWRIEGDRALIYHNATRNISRRYPFTLFGRITEPSFCDAGRHGIFFLSAAGEAMHIDRHTLEADNMALWPEMADDKQHSRYYSMRLTPDSVLWLTTTSAGVFCLNFPTTRFRLIGLPGLADAGGVKSLYQQANGDIWVGGKNKTLYIVGPEGRPKRTLTYTQAHIGSVYYIMPDRQGNLWLSTKGDGIVKATPDASQPGGYRFEHFRHNAADPTTISSNNVYMSMQDSRGRIWVCTLDGGLNLIEHRDGKIVFRHKNNGMVHYPPFGLYMEVRNIAEDAKGQIWVGTIDGLMTIDSRFGDVRNLKFTVYRLTEVNTRANADVNALYRDHTGSIWVGSFGGGLSKIVGFDEKNKLPLFETIGLKEGLQGDVTVSIVEDRSHRLWLGTEQGLACYDPAKGRIHRFGRKDGFPDLRLAESAALLTRNGEVWMGSDMGILAFRPENMQSQSTAYKVYIVNATVNNQDIRSYTDHPIIDRSITYTDRLVLGHNQNMFTLEFAALNFRNPETISYRYRLEGYDKDWHYSGRNRIASYTNVPPGRYRFVVESIDASNPDATARRTMEISVLPPWWATWWAYVVYAALAVGAVWLAVRYARYAIRVRNDVYVQTKLAEFKRKFYMEQQDLKFIDEVNHLIGENLTNPDFDIEALASGMKMGRSTFFKKLKAITGLSPLDFVKEYKLNRAVELLQNPDASVTDVAYLCGFSDAGYFGKCFRKKFGMSPRDFMQQKKD